MGVPMEFIAPPARLWPCERNCTEHTYVHIHICHDELKEAETPRLYQRVFYSLVPFKGQCHEIFCFRFFFMNHLPPSP
jgi:hypothetical protein